ncbi:MAG: membrane protein insertion efficiency factor YidD [Candidatus Omnitrophica bacterium]|nr:membrane protein insertion efficiency factor YidD [Candidatus Omnitrophota bacterium]
MAKKMLIIAINFYRKYLSCIKIQSCRFYPTCSAYAAESLEKFGALKGLAKSARRLLKCHPFNPGGYDPVE